MNNRNLENFLTSVEGGYHSRSIHFHNGRISIVRPLSWIMLTSSQMTICNFSRLYVWAILKRARISHSPVSLLRTLERPLEVKKLLPLLPPFLWHTDKQGDIWVVAAQSFMDEKSLLPPLLLIYSLIEPSGFSHTKVMSSHWCGWLIQFIRLDAGKDQEFQ